MPDGSQAYVIVQGAPIPLEVEMQDAAETATSIIWWQVVLIPLLMGAGGLIKHWFDSRNSYTSILLQGYLDQMKEMRAAQEEDRTRIVELERTASSSILARDRAHRIAHRALDRVDDQNAYFTRREEERLANDPEKIITAWVPEPVDWLIDPTWTARQRAILDALVDSPPSPATDPVGK